VDQNLLILVKKSFDKNSTIGGHLAKILVIAVYSRDECLSPCIPNWAKKYNMLLAEY
jgi:hypothetical protein